tara:strand:- start:40 stop:720 length:681 start_codon:yes stop_codon:yes gene_type:complete
MTIFDKALENYTQHFHKLSINPKKNRIEQLEKLTNLLNTHFKFDIINCIETGGSQNWNDGMVGYYFAHLSNITDGRFTSVDTNPGLESKVYKAYHDIDPNLKITHITDDSLNLLKSPPYIPNLVHLDSWDVWLTDPLPSALHGWREFEAIESKMPIGSIIVIDDNFYPGEKIPWYVSYSDGRNTEEIIDIKYPLGKGAHIYQWFLGGEKNWKILDAGYKLVIQKQW